MGADARMTCIIVRAPSLCPMFARMRSQSTVPVLDPARVQKSVRNVMHERKHALDKVGLVVLVVVKYIATERQTERV